MATSESPKDVSFSQGIRMMFYAMKPNETSFPNLDEVPDYVKQATPFFISLMLLELVLGWILKGKLAVRVDDALTSISAGILSRLPMLFFRSIEFSTYIYVWEKYRLFNLPWDSPWTWHLTFLGVDLGYYWFHRMAHEVNIMWAAHQTHHSSEAYNLSTALRQSALQVYTSWIFYCPLALIIPPPVYAVHLQFNLLYQFWIHTEVIENLGPLELILNTPSHHRVHHGRNRYCIDKNFAGTLIIWDRIFGTFEAENEKVSYGLTHPINTFEPLKVQFHHMHYIWTTFWITPGLWNKLSVIFKGPGWSPGKPRLGLLEEIPEVTGKEVPYATHVSGSLQLYALVQFALMLGFYEDTFADKDALSQATLLLRSGYIILTLTSIGFLMEQRPQAAILETFRCSVFLMLYWLNYLKPFIPSWTHTFEGQGCPAGAGTFLKADQPSVHILFSICTIYWAIRSMRQLASGDPKEL
uniref:Alkylglycerol monooxygenase n=1 Tax=Phascolarctos cinereus TaxID=38626 RepID=A0A6P5LBM7_PHACI|nr:alkylglycerol monooxygenase isoform X4 [Phascolarctos cinereus]